MGASGLPEQGGPSAPQHDGGEGRLLLDACFPTSPFLCRVLSFVLFWAGGSSASDILSGWEEALHNVTLATRGLLTTSFLGLLSSYFAYGLFVCRSYSPPFQEH